MASEFVVVGADSNTSWRRLAAVVFADVVGWSALIGRDDIAAMLAWKRLRTEVVEPLCELHGARVIEVAGDALIVEMHSVVAAAHWAMALQANAQAFGSTQTIHLRLRVGITIDDVLLDREKVVGDGVNVAARLQQMGEAGDVIITAAVADLLHNKTTYVFEDLGDRGLKNIERPVRVLRMLQQKDGARIRARPHLAWGTRPRIAVMPFAERGAGAGEGYFGDGITDEIVARLSKSRSFYVISRTSTSRYAGQTFDSKALADELGVRYLLTGSVQRSGGQLRINTELTDAQLDLLIWNERFLGSSDDIFQIQASIAGGIAAAIEPNVERIEALRTLSKPTHSLSAFECFLRGQAQLYSLKRDEFTEAKQNLVQAIALDPQFGRAHAYLAWWHNLAIGEGLSSEPILDKALALHHASRAVEIDPADAQSLAVLAHVSAFLHGRLDAAHQMFDEAIKVNDSSAFVWGVSASTCCFRGEYDEALQRLQSARKLSPFDPMLFYFTAVAAIAEFGLERLEPAIDAAQRSLRTHQSFLPARRMLCAALALKGHHEAARQAGVELLAIEPKFRVGAFCSWYPLPPRALGRLRQGLLEAGLPE